MTDLKRYHLDCADGEWTPYDEAEAALLQARADAAAAQALMVERAVAEINALIDDGGVEVCCGAGVGGYDGKSPPECCGQPVHTITGEEAVGAILRLAPDAGTAELAKLRERAEKADDMEAERDGYLTDLGTVIMTLPPGLGMRSAGAVGGVKMLRAERDTLAASLAAQTQEG